MQVHNRDIFPTPGIIDTYSLVRPLIVNPLIDEAFSSRERTASQAKRHYHRCGRSAMLLVLVSMLSTLSAAYVVPPFPGLATFRVCAIILGAVGLSIQIHLLLAKTKQVWLLNRFAAERLRSIKFQAYALATISESTTELKHKANAFYATEVARLEAELNAADAVLIQFSPREATLRASPREPEPPVNLELTNTACDAYRDLRIAYQRRFAADEIALRKQSQRIGATIADVLYMLGVALTVCALTVTVIVPTAVTLARWIDFLALAAFVIGLLKAIMDNASLSETSQGRYEDYIRALDECEEELAQENANFSDIVRRIERTALGELAQFCQAALRISYRL